MIYIDRFCLLLGVVSLLTVALSLMYVLCVIIFSGVVPMPPITAFIGLLGILSAMLSYAAAHLLKGDLFP
jgi:hypothetical protein